MRETLPVVVPDPEDVLDTTEDLDAAKDPELVAVIEDVVVADESDDIEAERVRVMIDDCVPIAENVCDCVVLDVPDDVPVLVFSLDGLGEVEALPVDESVNVPSDEVEAEALLDSEKCADDEADAVDEVIAVCVPIAESVCDCVVLDVPDDEHVLVFSLDGLGEVEALPVDESVNVPSDEVEAEALLDSEKCADDDADAVDEVIAVALLEMQEEREFFEVKD